MVDVQMEADEYWEQFEYNFDQVYMKLLTQLKDKFPDLTRTNLKLCAYLRLNMSSKEIASLMNITPSGIDKARNRLRKKLISITKKTHVNCKLSTLFPQSPKRETSRSVRVSWFSPLMELEGFGEESENI
jgi:predicted DNA-binding protein YlxM (UPF0122 family)